nr:putative oxidoreductase [Ipomoea batatas]
MPPSISSDADADLSFDADNALSSDVDATVPTVISRLLVEEVKTWFEERLIARMIVWRVVGLNGTLQVERGNKDGKHGYSDLIFLKSPFSQGWLARVSRVVGEGVIAWPLAPNHLTSKLKVACHHATKDEIRGPSTPEAE